MVLVICGFWLYKNAGAETDFRTAKISEEGIEMTSMSFKRKMVSKIIIDKEEKVWVPEGYGWYRSGSVKKLLENENKVYLLDKILFYGVGFDVNLWLGEANNNLTVISRWGWYPWLRYKLEESGWLYKEENLTDLKKSGELIDRIMLRDMAGSDILESKIRVVVYNSTTENGLAQFVGKNIERLGFAVTGYENAEAENFLCKILLKKDNVIFTKHFAECEIKVDANLSENEVEIYFGEKFAQMINYQSYINN